MLNRAAELHASAANCDWLRAVQGGKPTGLQIVEKHNADFALLQLAYAFEQATGFRLRRLRIGT
jgi:Asp-tRNA(Asn)/Glu-tRNA(Gln) amidotransferase A subunit family amidase